MMPSVLLHHINEIDIGCDRCFVFLLLGGNFLIFNDTRLSVSLAVCIWTVVVVLRRIHIPRGGGRGALPYKLINFFRVSYFSINS